ncbi:maintenance of mitochondrial structure and function-domain-containing protein [Catenaria anguillulae PL171]|uniref:COP9 signalosome complex subunit 6 n=1 Tax=Catenaria anguillulae PL171 TaxID=765915 RepID=A0A1Y2H9U6_9FUNG|nr:maintenance of mitochondrial structure and function-domain-containing protein [Catenaria anguillulae PL171]
MVNASQPPARPPKRVGPLQPQPPPIPDSSGVVHGAILGTQAGRRVELVTSFEVKVHLLPAGALDNAKYQLDIDLFTQRSRSQDCLPGTRLLGWYATTITDPLAQDLDLHRQFMQFNELPLYARLDPTLLLMPSKTAAATHGPDGATTVRLPFIVYEGLLDPHSGDVTFAEVPIKVETGEAERVAVAGVAKDAGTGGGASGPLIAHLTSQRNALDMLQVRIKALLAYVDAVRAGTVPADHALLRQIASVTHQLPSISGPQFAEQFAKDYSEVLLALYLAVMTKTTQKTNDLVDRHVEATANQSVGGGPERMSSMSSMGGRRGGRHRADPRGMMGMMGGMF